MTLSFLGNSFLSLSIFSALIQIGVPQRLASPGRQARTAALCTLAQFFFTSLTFLTLVYGFLVSDVSLVTVALHSHPSKPFLYRLAGAWGSHEGSLLLWCCLSTGMSFAFAYKEAHLPHKLYGQTLTYLGVFNLAFFAFVLLTSNPFFTTGEGPLQGRGMNPLLQDPSMLIHPPLLYFGYVGFMVPFALVLSFFHLPSSPEGKRDIPMESLRPWVFYAWVTLTLGICLGSYWAYYELGWGGWWFWDPVENVSLMPWCLGTALLHALILVRKTKTFIKGTLFLTYLTFLFCLLGTFLTRSGLLSSVHSFAHSPERGFFIMSFIGLISVYFLGRFLLYKNQESSLVLASRQGGLILGIFLLMTLTFLIFLGTFYPLFHEWFKGEQVSLGPSFYRLTVVPLALLGTMGMTITPLLPWKKIRSHALWISVQGVFFAGMLGFFISLFVAHQKHFYALVTIPLSFALIGSIGQKILEEGLRVSLAQHGMRLAHVGFAVCLLGMVMDAYNTEEISTLMRVGDRASLGSFTFHLKAVQQKEGPNFKREQATLDVSKGAQFLATLEPEKRFYVVEKTLHSEVSLKNHGFSQFYGVLGDYRGFQRWEVRLAYHPFVLLIWGGGFLMALGGLFVLFSRRFSSS